MKPITFNEQNAVAVGDGCQDLPMHMHDGGVISCWELSDEEAEHLKQTGKIWLSVHCRPINIPPVFLTVYEHEVFTEE